MLLFCTSFPVRRLPQPRGVGTNLLTALGSTERWCIPLRPLNLPDIFYRHTTRANVRLESLSVGGAMMEPLQLGV